jgi:Flp pilus assembly protein TadD
MKRDLAIAAALVTAIWAIYGQTIGFEFLSYDDDDFVTRNAQVHAGISVDGALGAFVQRSAPLNWLPLTVISYMIESTLFGLDPAAFHATNVALHALGAVLLYALLRSLTGAPWTSGIAAALFALHPMRVESVAWVTCRKDVLSAVFGLSALIAYARYAKRGSPWGYAAAFVLTAAALLAKATWVSLPFLYLLLDYWPLRRLGASAAVRLLAEKLPFFALSAAMMVVTSGYQAGIRVPLERLGVAERLAHALAAYGWYLGKTIWPTHLSPHYPHPYLAGGGVPWTGAQIAFAALALAAITALAVRFAQRGYPLVGWLWFLGTFAPVIGFVQHGTAGMADRYTHLPHMGLFAAVAFGGFELCAARLHTRAAQRIAASAAAALLVAFGWASFAQARVWRNTETLFAHALRVMPRDAMIQEAVANNDLEAGRYDEALHHAKTAWNLRPGFRKAGRVFALALQRREAAAPNAPLPDFLFDGGPGDSLAHQEVAEVEYSRGNADAALDHVRRALELTPDSIRALTQLALLLRERGDDAGAGAALRRIADLSPNAAEANAALDEAEREAAPQ